MSDEAGEGEDEFGAVAPAASGRKRREARPPVPPDDQAPGDDVPCPIVALGQLGGVYHFLSRSGELRSLAVRELSPNGILSLFDGDAEWLKGRYPKRDQDGRPTGDWAPRAAAAGLMRMCAKAGLWSSEIAVRSVGVWMQGGRLLVHAGDEVWTEAEGWRPAGVRLGEAIYPAAPRVVRPAVEPGSQALGRELFRRLKLWPVRTPGGRLLLAGWISIALLGAAPAWRPHVLISAGRGSGKTTLSLLAKAVLGAQGIYANNFSEAGLRQAPSGQGRGIILDEAEGDQSQVREAISFLRQLSDRAGAQMLRGSGEGTAKRSEAAAPVWLSAIHAPALEPQDRSRITEIELAPLPPNDAGGATAADEAIAWAEANSPALRARAIAGYGRYREDLGRLRSALIERGADGRQADQLGALLAAASMMWSDEPLQTDGETDLVDRVAPLLSAMQVEDAEESDPRRCLMHLLTSHVEHWGSGSKSTIGRLLVDGLGDDGAVARSALRSYGLRLEPVRLRIGAELDMAGPVLVVANGHRGLLRLYDGSSWPAGGHRRALLRLAGAAQTPTCTFDGVKSRGVAVPAEWLPSLREDDGDGPD